MLASAEAADEEPEVVVAATGALTGQALPDSWVKSFKREQEKVAAQEFEVGEYCWMQNPYFKDGTRLRVGPTQEDAMLDQYLLNDDEVELLEFSGEEKAFVRVRRRGRDDDDEGEAAAPQPEGWVRTRNVSKIQRQAGLPDLGELAQMAVDALASSERQVNELETLLVNKDDEIAQLKAALSELEKRLQATQAAQAAQAAAGAPAAAPAASDASVGADTAAKEAESALQAGEVVFMLNPYFVDGTRLRREPKDDSEFNDQFVLNDEQVTILELSGNGFAKIQRAASADDRLRDAAAASVEGWVRTKNLTRVQRSSGLMDLRQSFSAMRLSSDDFLALQMASAAAAAAAAASDKAGEGDEDTVAADGEGAAAVKAQMPGGHIQSHASSVEYEAAARAAAMDEMANEIASQIKIALERTNVRTQELFRDWDSDRNGLIDKKEFQKSMAGLGVKASPEELDEVFKRWDADGSGRSTSRSSTASYGRRRAAAAKRPAA